MAEIANERVRKDYKPEPPDSTTLSHLDNFTTFMKENLDKNTFEICDAALEMLRGAFAGITVEDRSAMTFEWLALVLNEYLKPLERGNAGTLLALAYYCVLLQKISGWWWIRGWPAYILGIIGKNVDDGWKEIIQLPLQVVGVEIEESMS